ncbi:MAG: hypothetical protein ACREI5_04220 [Candidatus Methylomirabilales bacterium]
MGREGVFRFPSRNPESPARYFSPEVPEESAVKGSHRLIAMSLGLLLGWTGSATAAPFAYVANFGSNNVSVIDTARNVVIATVPVGNRPFDIAVNPAGTRVYVTNREAGTVSVINAQTNTVVATVAVGAFPIGVAVHPDGTRVYVANSNDGTVSVIDAAKIGTGEDPIMARVPVGDFPRGVAVHPDGTRVYVTKSSLFGDGTISVIDTVSNSVTAIIAVAPEPSGVAVHPAGTRLYFVNVNSVSVMDTVSHEIIAVIHGDGVTAVAVGPDGTRVYATVEEDVGEIVGLVFVIDTASNSVTKVPLGLGRAHSDIAVTPTGRHAYLTSNAVVDVFDTASNRVVGTIPVGTFPLGIAIGPPPPGRSRVGLLGGTPQHPEPPPEDIPSGGGTARIPLGRVFFVEVFDQNGMPAVSTFTLEGANANPQITEARLFPDHVAIPFDRDTPSVRKEFQAVHLGNVTLKVYDAADPTSLRFSLPIEVTKPSRLGDTNNQVDGLALDQTLIDLGHRRGIPPHFVKGQIKREAAILPSGQFKPNSYRYEPLTVDLRYISDCVDPFKSGNCHLRRIPPYALYRLKTDDRLDRLDQGTGLDPSSADISPREALCIFKTDGITRRFMTEFDELISAQAIFDANDRIKVPRGDPCVSQNWMKHLKNPIILNKLMTDPNALNLTAQTTIASSYGLLQILYSTAIAPMQWQGVNGKQNPSLLFDTPSNVSSGGGSLVLGSGYLRRIFPTVNPPGLAVDPDLANPAAMERAFRRAFNNYRGDTKEDALESGEYGVRVINFSKDFLPIPSGPIFASP